MNRLKQIWLIARCGLRETFTDTHMVVPLLVLGFIYDNGIRTMLGSARKVQAPLGVFEGFIMCLNDWKYVVLFLLGFLFLLIGVPRVNNEYIFFVYRAGKKLWFFGELLHLFIMSVLYTLLMLLVSILGVCSYSFIGNIWSDYSVDFTYIYMDELGAVPHVDESVFRYDYPYQTTLNCLLLMVLCLLVLGTIVLLFNIINNKTLGLILVVLFSGFMVVFSNYRVWFMWLLPTSHSVISLHHIYVFKRYMVELKYSYMYLVGAEAVLCVLCCLFMRRKNYVK